MFGENAKVGKVNITIAVKISGLVDGESLGAGCE